MKQSQDKSQGMIDLEQDVLDFWESKKIFEKSLKQTKNGKPYVWYDGPPTANGKPHMGHLLTRTFKDLLPRFKTMQGYHVARKAGWDTHGLPVELEIEKKLGFSGKEDIEKYGIIPFNKLAKESIWEYKALWEKFTKRVGFWVDMDDPYITYQPRYIESLWWIFKQIDEKGLLFKGHKILPWCPRCGTALSSHEVADGYKEVVDTAVTWKFSVKQNQKVKNTKVQKALDSGRLYFTAWTTTPWSTPTTMGLSIGPKFTYVVAQVGDEYVVMSKQRVADILKDMKYKVVVEVKGSAFVGLEYEPVLDIYRDLPELQGNDNVYHVYAGDYVEVTEGTGMVTINGTYGEIDMEAAQKNKLPIVRDVDPDGKFNFRTKPYEGMSTKDGQAQFVKDMQAQNKVLKVEDYKHTYPHCWRCKTPLLYYARDSWFIGMSKLRKQLVANNKKVNWVPDHVRDGRFGEFLKEAKDWAISRERYWGTPLPIWECTADDCSERRVVGSLVELNKYRFDKSKGKNNWPKDKKGELDLHRPFVDDIYLKCAKCKSKMKRVEEVADAWFDSGSMPYAQWHYPFENKATFAKSFPADFIAEGIDQTRGWFYTLLAVATALGKGPAYTNVICFGLVMDEHGKKMSKSIGNVVDPWDALDLYGADATRWFFYTINSPGDSKNFAMHEVGQQIRSYLMTLRNTLRFLQSYGGTTKVKKTSLPSMAKMNALDKWFISRLHSTIKTVTHGLEAYNPMMASRALEAFVVNDVSNWWVRRSRSRFQRAANKKELKQAVDLLRYALVEVTKLTAPFTPFIADHIYRQLVTTKESVHLESWPKANTKLINKKLETNMSVARTMASDGLAQRREKQIKVRQPLASVTINKKLPKDLQQYIQDELNVKKVIYNAKQRATTKLDTKLTKELLAEGQARDVARSIQELRKQAGYDLQATVKGYWHTNDTALTAMMEQYASDIAADTLLKPLTNVENKTKGVDAQGDYNIADATLWLAVKK